MEHNNTATTIKLISDLLEKKANSELGRYNITLSQARILSVLFLSKADSLSLKALEKLFHGEWRTEGDIVTDESGCVEVEGFKGMYTLSDGIRKAMLPLNSDEQSLGITLE